VSELLMSGGADGKGVIVFYYKSFVGYDLYNVCHVPQRHFRICNSLSYTYMCLIVMD